MNYSTLKELAPGDAFSFFAPSSVSRRGIYLVISKVLEGTPDGSTIITVLGTGSVQVMYACDVWPTRVNKL